MDKTLYGVATDYDYTGTHKRERLTIWSSPFMSTYEGDALALPKQDGYMVTTYVGEKIRVSCPVPRNASTFGAIDEAINTALNDHYARLEETDE
jgi:hypothetical protein